MYNVRKEKMVERAIIKGLRESGLTTYKMSVPSVPGFPDILINKGSKVILVEVKYITNSMLNKPLKVIFTDMQIPFYALHVHQGGNNNVYLLLYEGGKIHAFHVDEKLTLVLMQEDYTVHDFLTTFSHQTLIRGGILGSEEHNGEHTVHVGGLYSTIADYFFKVLL